MDDTQAAGTVAGDEGVPTPEVETTAAAPADTQETPETPADETKPEDTAEPDDKPAKTPWYQRRIAQLTARTAALEAQVRASAQNGEQIDPADIERIADQRAEQKVMEREIHDAANRTAERGAAEFKDWETARAALVGNFADEIRANPGFIVAVTSLDNGHAVFRHLGLNPDEADRILSMNPAKMGVELAKLERKLTTKAPAPVSKAPAPIKPIEARVVPEQDPDKMSEKDWLAWRNAQLKKR